MRKFAGKLPPLVATLWFGCESNVVFRAKLGHKMFKWKSGQPGLPCHRLLTGLVNSEQPGMGHVKPRFYS